MIAVESAPAAPDMTAYYADFWLYASYYGEPAARVYYTQWSPPEGTPAPAGTVLPGTVQTPIVEVRTEVPKVSDNYSKSTSVNNSIADPEVAAAYEEYKLEVSTSILCFTTPIESTFSYLFYSMRLCER